MNKVRLAAMLALPALSIGSAYAATTTGRITYISTNRKQLMLDNYEMYSIGPEADLSSIAVADRVTIRWNKKNGEDVITAIAKTPLSTPASG